MQCWRRNSEVSFLEQGDDYQGCALNRLENQAWHYKFKWLVLIFEIKENLQHVIAIE